MKAIQDWLGHSNFATTANVYAHLDYDSKLDTANTISSVLSIHTNRRENSYTGEQKARATPPTKEKRAHAISPTEEHA